MDEMKSIILNVDSTISENFSEVRENIDEIKDICILRDERVAGVIQDESKEIRGDIAILTEDVKNLKKDSNDMKGKVKNTTHKTIINFFVLLSILNKDSL